MMRRTEVASRVKDEAESDQPECPQVSMTNNRVHRVFLLYHIDVQWQAIPLYFLSLLGC